MRESGSSRFTFFFVFFFRARLSLRLIVVPRFFAAVDARFMASLGLMLWLLILPVGVADCDCPPSALLGLSPMPLPDVFPLLLVVTLSSGGGLALLSLLPSRWTYLRAKRGQRNS
jgi:hypothetical protein